MARRILSIVAVISAVLFLTLLLLWVLKVRVEWRAGEPGRGYLFAVTHGDITPDMVIAVPPLFFFDVPIFVPMALLLVLPASCGILFLLRRRRVKTRGFPVDASDSAAAS